MSRATFGLGYDGPALRDGTMDVRDLAPALLAVGQLFDAANRSLNGDAATVGVHVRATGKGSFEVFLEVVQTYGRQLVTLLAGDEITAAVQLRDLIGMAAAGGAGACGGLIWLIKRLRGKKPDRVERLSPDTVRLTVDGESLDVPLKVLRLYQDLAVRDAAERVVLEPLRKPGITTFFVIRDEKREVEVSAEEAEAFAHPSPEETDQLLVDEVRKAAFSIVALAFKEDNKWRLFDGNSTISATIADESFLSKVNSNAVSFAKGDVLVCEVRTRQTQTRDGLRTENVVERVIEHRPAPRQLSLTVEDSRRDDDAEDAR